MAPLVSRPSVGRKPVGQVVQQPQQQVNPQQAPVNQGVPVMGYQQPMGGQQVWQQQGQQQPVYQQQPMQQPVYQQQPGQQPVYQQGQQRQVYQQQGQQQPVPQQPGYQQPVQQQAMQQQPAYQQLVQLRTAPQQQQQQPYQQQAPQQQVQQQPVQQRPVQQQLMYQQTIPQQQAPQQPAYRQQIPQQPVQQYQQAVQQQPVQQRPVQQYQQPVPQQPLQQQQLQQRPIQQQPVQQYPQPAQQQQVQQRPAQQQPLQQQPVQQQPIQQQSQGQRIPAPSNLTSQAVNRQSISSPASVRSAGSVTSSHTNPSQTFGSPTTFPTSVSQHAAPSIITCSLCSTDISNDSTHLECLACTYAQIPTFFCTQCCVSKGAVTNHHHHMSNFVSVSDVVVFDPEVSVHGWDVRKSAIGITWYHHKGSKIKTFEKPKPPIPVTQPQVFRADSNLPDGWEEIKDPDGRLFFYHRANKVSKWTRPQGYQLPAGWIECTNPDGRTYYLNTITQATSWDRPVGSSPSVNDDQKSIRSTKSAFLETPEWSPTDKRQSISSPGQITATPQSPTSIRSSTIMETTEWSSNDIEKTTVPAHRASSVPNTLVETTSWSPSDPQHRPIPTRAETQPLPCEWESDQYGNRRQSRTFSKDSLANLRPPPGSAAATKAVAKSTKTVANATAKGMKGAAMKLKNSKNAQRIVAGVGMAAVNAVLIDQFGVKLPNSVGTAAVGLVNTIDFNETTTVVEVTDTDGTVGNDAGDSVDVSGDANLAGSPDGTSDTVDANQINTMAGNDYVVGGGTDVIETTTVQEEVVFIPGGPTQMAQQPQQMKPGGTYGGLQNNHTGMPRNAGPGPSPGSAEWEFSSGMQRPAAMIGSHIPIHVPNNSNQRVAPAGASAAAPTAGAQTQRSGPPMGPGQHQGPAGHGNVAQSHITVHSHQPQWANQPQIPSQHQGPNPQQAPHQPLNKPQAHQPPRPQQAQMPNQQHGPQRPNQQQGPHPQRLNQQQNTTQPQLNQQQRPQFQNPGRPQGVQSQTSGQPPRPVQRPPGVNQNQSKPLLKPQQKAALMNVGMKIGSSLLRSAIRSSMSGNSGGDNYDYDDNDNSFDFGDTSNFDVPDSDFSNNGGNGFDSNDNFDDTMGNFDDTTGNFDDDTGNFDDNTGNFDDNTGNFDDNTGNFDDNTENLDDTTGNYDMQDQGQDQNADANQQFDNDFGGTGFDTTTAADMNDFGGNDQFVDGDNPPDNADDGNGYNDTTDQQATDTTGYNTGFSVDAGLGVEPDANYNEQADINLQAQGTIQASTDDDNAAMNGVFSAPDTLDIQNDGSYDSTSALQGDQFPQDTMPDPNAGADTSSATADNLWTVNFPDTSSSQNTAAYAGLTSASLSGPMMDYYDSFANFGGEIPLDQDPDQDQGQDQDPSTPVDSSSGIQGDGFFQDPTLASADQDISEPLNQDDNTLTLPDSGLDADPPSTDQSFDQSQDPNDDLTTEDADNVGSTTPTSSNTGDALQNQQAQTAAISQLYDGSAYDDPESAGTTPVDERPMTPTGITKMAPLATVTPLTPPAMPTPDSMPDPALLTVGQ